MHRNLLKLGFAVVASVFLSCLSNLYVKSYVEGKQGGKNLGKLLQLEL